MCSGKYNGWSNWETWTVVVILDNEIYEYDFHDQDEIEEVVRDFYLDNVHNENATFIVNAFLSDVDWGEIAQERLLPLCA